MIDRMKRLAILFFILTSTLFLNACSSEHHDINGYIDADLVYVSSPSGGQIDQLNVARGQPIQQGDLIAQIEKQPYLSLYTQALNQAKQANFQLEDLKKGETRKSVIESTQAQVNKAEAVKDFYRLYLARAKHLVQTDSMSQQEFDSIYSNALQSDADLANAANQLITLTSPARALQIQAAIANLNASKNNELYQKWFVDQTTVKSPRSGYVYDVFIWPGERISNDRPIVSLLVPDQIKVIFFLPENLLSKIKLGQTIYFTMDGDTKLYQAKISFISDIAEYTPPVIYSQSSRKDLVFRIEARPSLSLSKKLHPGQPISVSLQG